MYTYNLPDEWQRDWLSGSYGPIFNNNSNYYNHAPEEGTLYEYMGRSDKSYRCPSLALGSLGSGIGSNGKFDYTTIGGLGGARVFELPDRIYRKQQNEIGLNGFPYTKNLPFIVEESPKKHLNESAIRGAFALSDTINDHHSKNSNYASPDGSASRFSDEFRNITGNEMFAQGKGIRQTEGVWIGVTPVGFNVWNWINQ